MNILITGACGVTSRSVVRSLIKSKKFNKLTFIGTDICDNEYGLFENLYRKIYRVPGSNEKDYKNVILKICREENIKAAIVIPEPEVLVWSKLTDMPPSVIPPYEFAKIAISKHKLAEILCPLNMAAPFIIYKKDNKKIKNQLKQFEFPVWIRDGGDGSTSGRGSFLANNLSDLIKWYEFNDSIDKFMISKYLPGRNLACCLLFVNGKQIQAICAERLIYFMSHLVISGVSGNTCKGKVFYDESIIDFSERAVRLVFEQVDKTPHGLFTVDLKESADGKPFVTEINLRHIAITSSFADAGANMAEAQLLTALGRENEISFNKDKVKSGYFFRDIDGTPRFSKKEPELKIGQSITQ